MSETIYAISDVAKMLGVTGPAVSNYQARYDDTPTPAYVTPDGRMFWSDAGLVAWQDWRATLRKSGPKRWRAS